MTQYEMTGKLAEKCEVSLEEARNALEKGGWNELTATHLLEQEKFRRMQALHEFAGEAAAVQFAPEQAAADEAAEAPEAAQAAAEAETTERIGTAARAESKKHDPKLGLKKLDKSQTEYIRVETKDKTSVIKNEDDNVFVRIKNWFGSALEYIGL